MYAMKEPVLDHLEELNKDKVRSILISPFLASRPPLMLLNR
jgi:hypothetical protein